MQLRSSTFELGRGFSGFILRALHRVVIVFSLGTQYIGLNFLVKLMDSSHSKTKYGPQPSRFLFRMDSRHSRPYAILLLFGLFPIASGCNKKDQNRADWPLNDHTVVPCAHIYAKANNGNFPDTLQQLGPSGSGCLDADYAKGSIRVGEKEMILHYHVRPDAIGAKTSFDLVTEFRQPGDAIVQSYFADETGLVHWNFSRTATARDWVSDYDHRVSSIMVFVEKLKKYKEEHGEFPSDAMKEPHANGFFQLEYKPVLDAHKKVSNFVFDLYPVNYKGSGDDPPYTREFRSFYMESDFVIHATPEDRRATSADPTPPHCQWETGIPCK